MTDTRTEQLLTTGEAATLLGSSRQHVVDLCESGDLPFLTVGKHRRLRREDAEEARTRTTRSNRADPRSRWLNIAVAGELVRDPDAVLERAHEPRTAARCSRSGPTGNPGSDDARSAGEHPARCGSHLDLLHGSYNGLGGDESAVPDFYAKYGERMHLPVPVTETAALYVPSHAGDSEMAIKRAWWGQVLDPHSSEALPWLKMANRFGWRKTETEVGAVVDWTATTTPPSSEPSSQRCLTGSTTHPTDRPAPAGSTPVIGSAG
jgi:excisionase family DNA binding protein